MVLMSIHKYTSSEMGYNNNKSCCQMILLGDSLISKRLEEAITIIEKITLSDHQVQHDIKLSQRKNGIIELNINNAIIAQNKLLT